MVIFFLLVLGWFACGVLFWLLGLWLACTGRIQESHLMPLGFYLIIGFFAIIVCPIIYIEAMLDMREIEINRYLIRKCEAFWDKKSKTEGT